jgi:hypothetical protein
MRRGEERRGEERRGENRWRANNDPGGVRVRTSGERIIRRGKRSDLNQRQY